MVCRGRSSARIYPNSSIDSQKHGNIPAWFQVITSVLSTLHPRLSFFTIRNSLLEKLRRVITESDKAMAKLLSEKRLLTWEAQHYRSSLHETERLLDHTLTELQLTTRKLLDMQVCGALNVETNTWCGVWNRNRKKHSQCWRENKERGNTLSIHAMLMLFQCVFMDDDLDDHFINIDWLVTLSGKHRKQPCRSFLWKLHWLKKWTRKVTGAVNNSPNSTQGSYSLHLHSTVGREIARIRAQSAAVPCISYRWKHDGFCWFARVCRQMGW